MTSKALSNNGFKEQLRWNIKSQKWLLIAFTVIRVLLSAAISIGICSAEMYGQSAETVLDPAVVKLLNDVTYTLTTPLMVVDVVIGTLCAFVVFNVLFAFLYSKRKTDLYHSFPVTRDAYYWAAVCFVLIINVISMIIEFAVVAVVIKLCSAVSFADLGIIFLNELVTFAILASVTGILALCVSVSGVVISYIINAVLILLVLPLGVYTLFISFEKIINGFANIFESVWALFPYGLLMSNMLGNDISFGMSIAMSLLTALIALFAGLHFYRVRKSENSETFSSSNTPLYFGVMGLALLVGTFACTIAGNVYISVAVAAILTAVIFIVDLIRERKVKKSTVFYWLGFTAVFAGVMFTAKYGTASYSNRIPEISEIAKIEVEDSINYYGSTDFLYRIFGGSGAIESEPIELSSEESFKSVIEFHKDSLANGDFNITFSRAKITYFLKDGKTVTRIIPCGYYEENKNDGMLEYTNLKTYENLSKEKEYSQKRAMPYSSDNLASVYLSVNNRAIVLKDAEAKKVFDLYVAYAETLSSDEEVMLYPEAYVTMDGVGPVNEENKDMAEVKFVFFTDKATSAAKEVFYKIPLSAYDNFYYSMSNSYIKTVNNMISLSDFEEVRKMLDDKGFFAPAKSIDSVTDDWKVVITSVSYSVSNDLYGPTEVIYPMCEGGPWLLEDFKSNLSGTVSGDLLIKTINDTFTDYDRNYLLEKAKTQSDLESELAALKTNGTGYIYYFTNDSGNGVPSSTKLYYTNRLK